MTAIHRQFVLSFTVMGAVLAYLPVFLRSRLADNTQVGLVLGTTGLAIILTPIVMTALADTRFQSRTLIAWCFGLSAGACGLLLLGHTLASLLVIHLLFCFAFWPLAVMQDGLLFAMNRQRERDGGAALPYHHVRVFGTVGFILPLVFLYFLLDAGYLVDIVLVVGAALAVLGLVNALTLPHIPLAETRRRKDNRRSTDAGPPPLPLREGPGEGRRFDPNQTQDQSQGRPSPQPPPSGQGGGAGSAGRAIDETPLPHPTRAAAGVLFRGPALVFCLAMFLAHLANAAYYSYYPIYLEDTVGFDEKWIGPISMIGVVIELPMMLGVGWLTRKLGLKGLLLLGLALMALRLVLLGIMPTPSVAVGTQLLHGMTVIAMYVIAPIYLNQLVDQTGGGDRFRNSMQGLFAMAVFGPARILGPIAAGAVADVSMVGMFYVSAGLTAVALLMLMAGFRINRENGLVA
ncbi:MFS transporter [Phycisphaeraceae bacterium D3-23]